MKRKLIINFTSTGMIPTKEMTPHVPITTDEIVKDILRAGELGASIAHVHARDENGAPSWKKELYEEIFKGVREKNKDIILCATTSGRDYPEFEKRSNVLEIEEPYKPDMASLTLSSLNFNKTASLNAPDMIKALVTKMNEKGIKPELEAFDLGMINYAKYLIHKDLLKPPYYFNLLFGNIACAQANLQSVGLMVNELPENSIYAFAGIGNFQLFMNSLAVIAAHGVRVGLEDNIHFDEERKKLATNEMLVKRIVDTAKALEVEISTPKETREMLGLKNVS